MYLYEYQEVPSSNKTLLNHIKDNIALHKYFKEDWGKIKAKQYCGVLNYNNNNCFILPKISNQDKTNLDIFMYMLMYAYNIKLHNEDLASCQNHKHTFIEVFIQMFARNLLRELQRGVYKEYITKNDNLTTLRGKYLINENLKYNFIQNRIYCEYDEFSMNNELNQFFIYAIKTLMPSVQNRKLLKQCELIFDEVEYKKFNIHTVDIHFHRLNNRFKNSFEFALLLLRQFVPLFQKDKKSFAFLFDMNVLFEKFIAKIVKSLYSSAKIQNSDNFNDLILKPDIILDDSIIDTKYKKLNNLTDIKQSDKLQAFAYGINYKRDDVMLLYPKHLDNISETIILGKNEKQVVLKMRSLDLNYHGNNFSEYIKKIKNELGSMV